MNRERRKSLAEIQARIESIMEDLETIRDEEEEYRDNMPENLQGSERYEKAEMACDNLASAYDSLEEVISYIEEATA